MVNSPKVAKSVWFPLVLFSICVWAPFVATAKVTLCLWLPADAAVPLNFGILWVCAGTSFKVTVCVLLPPVFCTVLNSVSCVSTPTNTCPFANLSQVPPK